MNNYKKYKDALAGMKFIDLFAGIGGFHIAMTNFGAECVFASEWDKHAQNTYSSNFNINPAGDITEINAEEIPEHDILCAGFPCQPFSISGNRKGFTDTRGTLFFDIARIAKYHKPKILFLENVRNFATHDKGNTLQVVETTLKEIGYNLWYKVLNASHFGLPQNRERIYMVAIRQDLNIEKFTFPEPTYEMVGLEEFMLEDEETKKYIIDRPDMVVDYSKVPTPNLLEKYQLRPVRVGTINKGGQGERIYSEYGHAVTLSAHGGGPGSKTGCYLVNNKVRKLAPRECARIQGFPEDFIIPVSDAQAWKQFGNSVPINVLNHILVSMIENEQLFSQLVYEEALT